MTASLFSIRAVEVVAEDHRRDLLAQARAEARRRAARNGARRWWPARGTRGDGPADQPRLRPLPDGTERARVPEAAAVVGLRPAREGADLGLRPPAAASMVDLHSAGERAVPSTRW